MQQVFFEEIRKHIDRNRYRRIFRKCVQMLCCVVVFCTTYALILPAITMEQTAFCGLEEHTHSEACYQAVQKTQLICTEELLQVHTHSDSCYDADANIVCGQADYVAHTHNESCWQDEQLVCPLPERGAHVHGDACYVLPETEPPVLHVHAEQCYTRQQGELVCETEEYEGHEHTDACYAIGETLECELTENHVHGEGCYEYPLNCTLSTEPHNHDDGCYGTGGLLCAVPENHVHGEGCTVSNISCESEEEGHEHGEGCYTTEVVCDIPEGHSHSTSCYESIVVCGKAEGEHHEHGGECYAAEPECICTMPENHVHEDSCYALDLICTVPVDPGHHHGDACYRWEDVLSCGLEDGQPEPTEPPEPVLNCTEPVAQTHVHGEACFVTVESEPAPICGNFEEDHEHTDACYGCGLEEHTHTLACYSDREADVESEAVWKSTFAHVALTGDPATDVVAIAQTQIGYTESTRNYEVWEDNSIHGYTRYGAWYGVPYGDWCGMFASFCLRYAGVNDIPINYGVRPWIDDLASRGLYYGAGETQPQKGSLIFFDWEGDGLADHVGIVAEVHAAQEHTGASITAIEGNSSNCVKYVYYSPDDPVILGYGLLPGQERVPQPEPEAEAPENTDILQGPVVTITSQELASNTEDILEPVGDSSRVMLFAAPRNGSKPLTSVSGSTIVFSLTNLNNTAIPKDEQGNYIVTAGTSYKLTMRLESPDGISPGTYTYQLPEGLTIVGGTGNLVADGVDMGTWTVTNDGFMTFAFNDKADKYTDVVLSAEMSATFGESDSIISIADTVKVVIKPPESELPGTKLVKFGEQGDGTSAKPDAGKIYWTIRATGHEGSQIPGSVLIDRIDPNSPPHSYTASDIEAGLYIGVSVGNTWREWTVYVDDPSLKWDENGWKYTMPETYNGEPLGNDNWVYYIKYTSTPSITDATGQIGYMNTVLVDNETAYGWAGFTAQADPAGIVKAGNFVADENGGSFRWKITANIPGYVPGTVPEYNWYVSDEMFVNADTHISVLNDIDNIEQTQITATYNGQTITVPHYSKGNAAANPIVWQTDYKSEDGRYCNIRFFSQCTCTENSCKYWGDNSCGSKVGGVSTDYCLCWTITEPVTIEIVYETSDSTILGYAGSNLVNRADLHNILDYENGSANVANRGTAVEEVKIPSMFSKKITQDFDGYIAKYTITLNEAKQNLSPDGAPITIIDEMTDSLSYIAGSMVITAEDANGNIGTLTYGTDYTLTYDGSANDDNTHILTIIVNHPQPVKYTLDYDTTLIVPDEIGSEGIPYSNSATVTIWGKELSADSDEKLYTNINFTAKTYQLQIEKKAAETDALLPGAVFGLFNEAGRLITTETTGEDGKLLFETSITDGIILREHEPCYIQEISAPEGFLLDNTKHWFYFCDQKGGCTKDDGILKKHDTAVRIPDEGLHTFHLKNTMMGYELPSTGGTGYEVYTAGGMLLMLAALILLYNQKKYRKEDFISS